MSARVRAVSGTGIAVLFTDLVLVVDNTAAVATIQLPDPAARYTPLSVVCLGDPTVHGVGLLQHASEKINLATAPYALLDYGITTYTNLVDWYLVPSSYAVTANATFLAKGGDQMGGNLGVLGMALDRTLTTTGTTGARTINTYAGTVNFAASASSLVVTSNKSQNDSCIVAQVLTADATMKSVSTQAADGSFTITANAAATAETKVFFWITH